MYLKSRSTTRSKQESVIEESLSLILCQVRSLIELMTNWLGKVAFVKRDQNFYNRWNHASEKLEIYRHRIATTDWTHQACNWVKVRRQTVYWITFGFSFFRSLFKRGYCSSVVYREKLMNIALYNTRLSNTKVSYHQNFEQELLLLPGRFLRKTPNQQWKIIFPSRWILLSIICKAVVLKNIIERTIFGCRKRKYKYSTQTVHQEEATMLSCDCSRYIAVFDWLENFGRQKSESYKLVSYWLMEILAIPRNLSEITLKSAKQYFTYRQFYEISF